MSKNNDTFQENLEAATDVPSSINAPVEVYNVIDRSGDSALDVALMGSHQQLAQHLLNLIPDNYDDNPESS